MLPEVGGLSFFIRWMVDSARRPGSYRMAAGLCQLGDAGVLQASTAVRGFPNSVSPSWGSEQRCIFFILVGPGTLGVSPACLSREFSGQAGLPLSARPMGKLLRAESSLPGQRVCRHPGTSSGEILPNLIADSVYFIICCGRDRLRYGKDILSSTRNNRSEYIYTRL